MDGELREILSTVKYDDDVGIGFVITYACAGRLFRRTNILDGFAHR